MSYYFEEVEKQEALKAALDAWLGTPYRHWAGVKGEGCDCIHFVVRVFEELGLGPFKIQRYNKDWHIHNTAELLLQGFREQFEGDVVMEELPASTNPFVGDIILYHFGKVTSHSAIYYDNHVYQSITGLGVERRHYYDKSWFKRIRTIMRLKWVA